MSELTAEKQREADLKEVCGQRPGDRRVRLQRPQRNVVARRVRAIARRMIRVR